MLKNPMAKRVGALLLVAMIVIPLVVKVSGIGKSDDENNDQPVIIDGIMLSQSFTNDESNITVKYPEGWFAQADDKSIVISNSETATTAPEPSEGDMAFTILPLSLKSLEATDLDSAFNAMANVLTADTTTTAGEVTYTVLNDHEARQMAISNTSQGDTALFAWIEGSDLIVTMGMAPLGDLADVLPYAKAMTATIEVDD